jgi:hypothetical protein
VTIRIRAFDKFELEIPSAMSRLAVVGALAGLLATAVIFSRNQNGAEEANRPDLTQAFQQPKDRKQAEGGFIPAPKVAELAEDRGVEIATAFPFPRRRPGTPGYYYELARAQGDGEEGEYVLVERRCIPKVDMPEPCYLPERGRKDFPLRRE